MSQGWFKFNERQIDGIWHYDCEHMSENRVFTTARFEYNRKLIGPEVAGKFKTTVAGGGRNVHQLKVPNHEDHLNQMLVRIRPDLEHDDEFMHMTYQQKSSLFQDLTGEHPTHVRRNNPYT